MRALDAQRSLDSSVGFFRFVVTNNVIKVETRRQSKKQHHATILLLLFCLCFFLFFFFFFFSVLVFLFFCVFLCLGRVFKAFLRGEGRLFRRRPKSAADLEFRGSRKDFLAHFSYAPWQFVSFPGLSLEIPGDPLEIQACRSILGVSEPSWLLPRREKP